MKQQLYTGVVEDRTTDPLKLGRCKVRVFGLHSDNKKELPTEDLPWAVVMQPITSAATSGVGHAPVGPVEGTWVVVMFNDEYNQEPIIIGTLGGVPAVQKQISYVEQTNVWRTADGKTVVAGDGTEVTSNSSTVVPEEVPVEEQKVFKVQSLSLSDAGFSALKQEEGLASLERDRRIVGSDKVTPDTKIYSYLDTKGIWTIGWGSTYMPDGSRVTASSTLTKAEADILLRNSLKNNYEPAVKRGVKVPITQSMYDALVSLVYNGWTGIFQHPSGTALNAGKYKEAASLIPDYKSAGLKNRRLHEQKLFVKDGFPTQDGEIEPAPVTQERKEELKDATQNPVIIKPAPGTNSSTSVEQSLNQVSTDGFVDPNKVFPKWKNEPDTHRLARHEQINKTIVFSKEAARAKGVPTATGSSWSQPPIPYNAKYPFNHVFSSESGHVQEFDDSPQNERIHTYHKSGTYTEVDVNGTQVNRIVGDNYEILERNSNVVIRGTCNVTIEGNSNVRIQNDSNIQVLGNANLNVTGNLKQAVGGNYQIHVGGQFHVDATKIYWNSQKATGISLPTEGATGVPAFGALTTPSRNEEANSNYESPDEGDGEDFINNGIKQGTFEEETTPQMKKDEKTVDTKPPEPISTECGIDIANGSPFSGGFRLSDNFTLGKVCGMGKSGIPSGVNYGLSDKDIVCNLRLLAVNVLEPIVKSYPNMIITSAWRSEKVNEEANGSKTSDHLTGCAADIQFPGFSRDKYYEVVQEIQRMLPAYRQIILEYKGDKTWIHVSFKKTDNKMQCLTMDAAANKVLKSGGFVLV